MPLQAILTNFESNQDLVNDYLYIIVPVIMSSTNKPEDIQHWYKVIVDRIDKLVHLSKEDREKLLVKMVLKIREAILKSYIIVGFPKTINGLQQLYKVTPENIRALLPGTPLRKEETWQDMLNQRKRGKELFTTIYNRHTDRVIKNMHNSHPDLAQTALYQIYGSTLGETSVLSAKETSLVVCAALMIQNIPLQLYSHSHGAFHNGATKEDMQRTQSIVSTLADHYQSPMAKL